jgi:3-dehydroquinate synthase
MILMEKIKVSLGERSYAIYIGNGIIQDLPGIIEQQTSNKQCVMITDSRVARLYGNNLVEIFKEAGFRPYLVEFPRGEKSKSLKTWSRIITSMVEIGVGRDWTLIAFGGGVAGDLAGFVAASYMRGIKYIQVTTTLLAQVDSSVGGKVGLNHAETKNLIGAFYQPGLVWIDTNFLHTLPEREILCGLAEIVKYGMIYDRRFFDFCEMELQNILRLAADETGKAIRKSCEIKAKLVSEDERDFGIREILNFGHTVGHALEAVLGYKNINHGEAVLWGMYIEACLAKSLGIFPLAEFARFKSFLAQIPLKASIDGIDPVKILAKMRMDKKVRNESIRFVLPVSIGETRIIQAIASGKITDAIAYALKKGWSESC